MVVPKRTVALLDRLMRALSHTLNEVEQDMGQQNNREGLREEHATSKRMRGPKESTSSTSPSSSSHETEYNGKFMQGLFFFLFYFICG